MILPHTHSTSLFGSGASLLNDWKVVADTLTQLQPQLRECRPHARDYHSMETVKDATKQHLDLEDAVIRLAEYANLMIRHLDR